MPAHGHAKIYPNPAFAKITVSGVAPGSIITIYSMDGKKQMLLKTKNASPEIDIGNLSKGTYFLQVTDGSNIQVISPFIIH